MENKQEFIRDICKVIPMSKSEAKSRLDLIIHQALAEERKKVVGLIEEIRGMEGVSNQALDYLQDRIEKDILSSLDSNPK